MPALVLGVIVLILLLFAAYSFSKADPKQAVRVLRYIGGGAALLFAVFLLVRGAIGPALSIGLIGLRRSARPCPTLADKLRGAHAEKPGSGLPRAYSVPGNGTRPRQRCLARSGSGWPASGRGA